MSAGNGNYVQKVTIDVGMQTAGIKSGISALKQQLKGLKLSDDFDKSVKESFSELEKALTEYEELASKGASNDKEANAIAKQWDKVTNAVKNVVKISDKLNKEGIGKKIVSTEALNKVKELQKKLSDLTESRGIKLDLAKSIKDQINASVDELARLKQAKDELQQHLSDSDYGKALQQSLADAESHYDELKRIQAQMVADGEKDTGAYRSLNAQISLTDKEIKKLNAENEKYRKGTDEAAQSTQKLTAQIEEERKKQADLNTQLKDTMNSLKGNPAGFQELRRAFTELSGVEAPNTLDDFNRVLTDFATRSGEEAKQELDNLLKGFNALQEGSSKGKSDFESFSKQIGEMSSYSSQVQQLTTRLTQFFSLTNGFNLLARAVRSAFTAIKDLDKAFTEIAVVSKYSVDDVWAMRSQFVQAANDIGASTNDLIEATTLYVQQGLSLEEAQKIATETMKMGRIANLNGKDATDLMTAAVRGYRMELTDANHVNDVYSNLAAHSASNTEELATAMSKTASTAYTSGASFENMSAFLAQIIETTREAPETAGTAMKTIISRFQELKEATTDIVDVDGEEVSVNRVEKALKTAGVALRDAKGEFRAFDDVILELASKWDTLDIMTQRYIATQTAGARQQSRFLALMNNYDRLLELTQYATDSAGASSEQFNKTMDSLQASLNELKNAWDLFLTGFANNQIITMVVDLLTQLLNVINKTFAPLNQSNNLLANLAGSVLQLAAAVFVFFMAQKGLVKALSGVTKSVLVQSGVFKAHEVAVTEDSLAMLFAEKQTLKTRIAKKLETTQLSANTIAWVANMAAVMAYVAIAVAVVAIIIAIIKRIKEMNSATEKQKKINENIDKLNSSLNETKNKISDVKKEWDSLNQANETLDNLTQGTQAWYEQLVKVNDQVLALIQKYPFLARYVQSGDNGQLFINEQGFKDFLEMQNEFAESQRLGILAQQSAASSLQTGVEVENLLSGNSNAALGLKSFGISGKELTKVLEYARENGIDLSQASIQEINEAFGEAGVSYTPTRLTQELGISSQTIGEYLVKESGLLPYLQQANLIGGVTQNASINSLGSQAWATASKNQKLSGVNNEFFMRYAGEQWAKEYEKAYAGNNNNKENQRIYAEISGLSLADIEQAIKDGTLSNDIIREVVSAREAQENYENAVVERDKNLNTMINSMNKNQKQSYKDFSKVLSGTADNEMLDVDYETYLQNMGLDDESINKLAEALGFENEKAMHEAFDISVADRQKYQSGRDAFLSDIRGSGRGLNLEEETKDKLYNLLQKMDNEDYQKSTMSAIRTEGEAKQIIDFTKNIDFSNPVQMFAALQQAMESGIPVLETWAQNMKRVGAGDISKGLMNTVDELEMAEESLSDIVKTEGKISSDKVKELAQSNKFLADMMELGVFSADQLADILTYIGEGGDISGYSNMVLEILSSFDTIESGYSDMMDYINNYDAGNDEGKGIDFLNSRLENIKDHIENLEYGNSEVKNSLGAVFDLSNIYVADPEQTEANINKYYDTLNNWLENDGLGFWQDAAKRFAENSEAFGGVAITDLGNGAIDLLIEEGMGYTDIVNNLAQAMGITAEAANMFLQDMAQHNLGLQQQIQDSQVVDSINSIIDSYAAGEKQVLGFTTAEVEALKRAGAWDSVLEALSEKHVVPLQIDTTDENGQPLSPDEIYNEIRGQLTGEDGRLTLDAVFNVTTQDDGSEILDYLSTKEAILNIWPNLSEEEADKVIEGWLKQDENHQLTLGVDGETYDNIEEVKTAVEAATTTDNNAIYTNAAEATEAGVTDGGKAGVDNVGTYFSTTRFEAVLDFDYSAAIAGFRRSLQAASTVNVKGEFAKGTSNAPYSGLALVGEKGPELQQNVATGATRLVGIRGPELSYVNKGDRIYSNSDTRSILRGYGFPGFSKGKWNTGGGSGSGSGSSSGSGSGSSSDSKKETDAWIAAYDWLYNLVQKTNEEIRRGNKLEHERQKLLRNGKNDAAELLKLYQEQLKSLQLQQQYWQEQHDKRLIEAQQIEDKYADLMQYAHYDENLGYVVINWDLINSVSGQEGNNELGERIDDYIKELEKIQDQIDDTEDELMDIEDQIWELQQEGAEEFGDLEQRIIDALKAQRQQEIDNAQALSDAIRDTNTQLLDKISDELSEYRSKRDMDEKQSDIESMERRLALLQSDTSGANDLEILKLQEEIDNARQDYTDTLIDKSIEEMTKQNEEAYEQRQQQIDLMQAQLDWDYENGRIALQADQIIMDVMSGEGTKRGEEAQQRLEDLLKEYEEYYEKGMYGRYKYENDYSTTYKGAYKWWMGDGSKDLDKTWLRYGTKTDDKNRILFEGNTPTVSIVNPKVDKIQEDLSWIKNKLDIATNLRIQNATPKFDVRDINAGIMSTNTKNKSDVIYYNINMENKISADYDVDEMWDKMKQKVNEEATYRNTVALDFGRR